MAIRPKNQGITRIQESEQTRQIVQEKPIVKSGGYCSCCRKFFNYLRADDKKLCRYCTTRYDK